MVSRLFASISEILSSTPNELNGTEIHLESNQDGENNGGEPPIKIKSKSSVKSVTRGLEILNAESLDIAIVHRLQSKIDTAMQDKDKPLPNSEGEVVYRSDSVECGLGCRIPRSDTIRGKLSRENSFPGTHTSRSNIRIPHVNGSSKNTVKNDTQTLQSQVEPATIDNNYGKSERIDFLASAKYAMSETEFEDKRNVVYQNSQFNLENASKEALVSTNSLPFKDDLLSETLMNIPMFGIPNPSLRIRHETSLTSATESIGAMDGFSYNTLLQADEFKRERKRSPSRATNNSQAFSFPGHLSATKIGEGLFEETMNEIIEKGGEDFRNKYSSWVWDVFHTNLMKMKSLLLTEFNEKLKATLNEREDEVAGLQKQYREKLAEFDATTEGFQKMIDNLYQENQRVLKAKDFVIEKLKKEFIECKNHFEKDLRRQMQSYRKEAEVEKIELQTRNDELMKIMLTDSSKCGLEDSFKREIESLHKMIKALTTQNDVLHQQLDEATNSASDIRQKNMEVLQSQLDNAKLEILELRKRLQYADREKEDLTISHNQQIAKLNRKMQETNTRYDHRLREVVEDMDSLRKKHAKEAKELKTKLANQDTEHGQMLSQVKQQYGQQVMSLSQAVSELQTELKQSGTAAKYPF
ncbi:unnamed protein product [Orchesella dallaii]|uniref:Uncharacterized protein n=1 Tax=Orchesella dallaii TaxID=48710 RepID=A0ABP1QWZ2_9HEXA